MSEDDKEKTPTIPEMPAIVGPARAMTPSGMRRVAENQSKPQPKGAKRRAALNAADAKSAQGYDALDDAAERVVKFTKAVEEGRVMVELEIDESVIRDIKKI